jgi:hypothetical protein
VVVVVDDDLLLELEGREVRAGLCAWKANWEGSAEAGEELFLYGSLE